MAKAKSQSHLTRRGLIRGAALAGAAAATGPLPVAAQPQPAAGPARTTSPPRPDEGMGVYAEGPIENPKDLAPALKRAIAVVKRGEPALLDVVTNGR